MLGTVKRKSMMRYIEGVDADIETTPWKMQHNTTCLVISYLFSFISSAPKVKGSVTRDFKRQKFSTLCVCFTL